jgi:hypothetical protein
MPGASGVLAPPRRTEAESCTASTIASGVDRGGFDLDMDCAIAAPVVPSASATSVDAIGCRNIMIGSLRFPILVHAKAQGAGVRPDRPARL